MDPWLFVLELLEVVVNGWTKTLPCYFGPDSRMMTRLDGDWGQFDLIKPVPRLADADTNPRWLSAPVPNCYHDHNTILWL